MIDDAGLVAGAGDQRDQRVVDDEHARLVADAPHDARGPSAPRRRDRRRRCRGRSPPARSRDRRSPPPSLRAAPSRPRARRRPAGSRRGRAPSATIAPSLVGEQAHGLRAAGVDAENVHASSDNSMLRSRAFHASRRQRSRSCDRRACRSPSSAIVRARAHAPRRSDEVRALWVVAHDADLAGGDRDDGRGGRRRRLQHAARAGARPRRRLLPAAARAARRRARGAAGASIRSPRRSRAAHAAGLQVHAWVNVNLSSSAADLPAAREHVDLPPSRVADGAARARRRSCATIDPRSPGYVGRLARWTRAASRPRSKGCTSRRRSRTRPTTPTAVVRDIAQRYAVDGIHLDYVRYPERATSTTAATRSRRSAASVAPDARRRRPAALDARRRGDPLAYHATRSRSAGAPSARSRLTALVTRCARRSRRRGRRRWSASRSRPTRAKPSSTGCRTGAAGSTAGCIDVDLPDGLHAPTRRVFADADRRGARSSPAITPVWAGIGAYRLSPTQIVDNIADRAPPRRRRHHPVLVRQPGRPAATAPDYVVAGRPRRVRRTACSTHSARHGPDLARLRRHRRLPAGDHGVRLVVRALPEDHPRLLPHRPVGAVVGDLLHDRRHRDEHADASSASRPRAYAGNMTFLQLALGYVIGRVLVSVLFIPAYFRGELFTSYELLQRRFGPRSRTLVGGHLPGHALARRRHPPVRHRAGDRGRHAACRCTWTVVVLGVAMIVYTVRGGVVGGDLDRRRADVRLRRRRAGRVRRAAGS